MRTIVVAVMMVLLWAVPCPGADSGFKQGASEIGKGIKEGAKEVGQGAKEAGQEIKEGTKEAGQKIKKEAKQGLQGGQGGDNRNQAGGPKAGPDPWRVVPGYR